MFIVSCVRDRFRSPYTASGRCSTFSVNFSHKYCNEERNNFLVLTVRNLPNLSYIWKTKTRWLGLPLCNQSAWHCLQSWVAVLAMLMISWVLLTSVVALNAVLTVLMTVHSQKFVNVCFRITTVIVVQMSAEISLDTVNHRPSFFWLFYAEEFTLYS